MPKEGKLLFSCNPLGKILLKRKLPLLYDRTLVEDSGSEKENLKNDCTILARSRTSGMFSDVTFSENFSGKFIGCLLKLK